VIPLTLVVLFCLFVVQKRGTAASASSSAHHAGVVHDAAVLGVSHIVATRKSCGR
jgi:K+ transporter